MNSTTETFNLKQNKAITLRLLPLAYRMTAASCQLDSRKFESTSDVFVKMEISSVRCQAEKEGRPLRMPSTPFHFVLGVFFSLRSAGWALVRRGQGPDQAAGPGQASYTHLPKCMHTAQLLFHILKDQAWCTTWEIIWGLVAE